MYQLGMQRLRNKELTGDTVFKNGNHDWFRPPIWLVEKETLRFLLGKLVSRAIITWQPFQKEFTFSDSSNGGKLKSNFTWVHTVGGT